VLLRRICNGVHGTLSGGPETVPMIHSALGGDAGTTREPAHTHGFPPMAPHAGLTRRLAGSLRRSPAELSFHIPRKRSLRPFLSDPTSLTRSRRLVERLARSQEGRRAHSHAEVPLSARLQTPHAAVELTQDKVVHNGRTAARPRGERETHKRNGKPTVATGSRDRDLLPLFSQDYQHLPFPFCNPRVEVGRTVMEG
jgi:hypothetical protein